MNSTILFSLVLVVMSAVCIYGAPADSDLSFENLQEPMSPVHGERQRRVTCDLLSVSTAIGSLNHAACAANCLAMGGGRRGGRCINGVCNCRF